MDRRHPRISVNKLGEYMTATPSRRRQIVKDQKDPSTFKVARYTDAEDAIAEYLRKGSDTSVLSAARGRLSRHVPTSEWDRQRISLCLEALDFFEKIPLDLSDCEIRAMAGDGGAIPIGGVSVSVRPNLQLVIEDKKGRTRVGLLKLHISKTFQLEEKAGDYVAAILRIYAEDRLRTEGAPSLPHLTVVDVFGGEVYEAPVALTRRLNDVEAACEEIAARWGSIV